MKTVSLALTSLATAVTACGVAHDNTEQQSSPPFLPVKATMTPDNGAAMPSAYRLVEVPTGIALGGSRVSKLVCAKNLVVGSQQRSDGGYAIAFDYRTKTVTDLGNLGVQIAEGNDGNAQGTYVGDGARSGGGSGAFVSRGGVATELPGIGGNSSLAYAINAHDQIVGQAAIPGAGDVDQHAVLWQPGCTLATDLGTLAGGYSFTRGINDAGTIVGTASDADHREHVVIWGPDHVLVDLGTLGDRDAIASDINASGQIIAVTNNDPNGGDFHHRSVLIDNGQFIDLGSLGGKHTYAQALNDRGDVVGSATLQLDQALRPFLYSNGTMVNLADLVDAPGWDLLGANDICDNGVIAGTGIHDGATRGFVLIPNP
jgi:probable HAF family extracellular repeat protein